MSRGGLGQGDSRTSLPTPSSGQSLESGLESTFDDHDHDDDRVPVKFSAQPVVKHQRSRKVIQWIILFEDYEDNVVCS